MNARLIASVFWLLFAASSVWAGPDPDSTATDSASTQRQILVMLHLAPAHFHPEASYAGSYDSPLGRGGLRRIAEHIAGDHELKLVNEWPMPGLGVDCFVMESRPGEPVEGLIGRLSSDPRVESAQPMNVFRVLGNADPLYPLQPSATLWHLDELHRIATGKGVRVAEVDTGVEIDHPDLVGQIALTKNFVDGSTYQAEAHGTAVAGIIAAKADDGVGIVGIAPGARLLALRACWQLAGKGAAALCNTFTVAKALQFALKEDAQVINLSLGGPQDQLLGRLLDVALGRGIAVVSAFDSSSADGGFPASHPGVLAVASEDQRSLPADILVSPGRDIPTTVPVQRWSFVSGSSYAAAHITGMVAMMQELEPHMGLSRMRDTLFAASAADAAGREPALVNACAVITRISGACACAPCALAREAGSPRPR